VRPDDLRHLAVPSHPQLHPDGVQVAYVQSEVDTDEDRTFRAIHLWDGARSRRFTHGPSDTAPAWSPDGRHLAFLRKGPEDGAVPQVVVMPADGGEAGRRTELPRGASAVRWAPDSRRLVVVGAEWAPELADLDEEERNRRPRRITRLPYRDDGRGYLGDRREHLWLIDGDGEREAVRLTSGEHDESDPVFRADGRHVLFLGDRGRVDELDPSVLPWEVDTESLEVHAVGPAGMWNWVGEGPDGAVYLAGLREPQDWPGVHRLWRCDAAGDDFVLTDLTGHLDRDVLPGSPGVEPAGPQFVDGGVVTALEGRGRTGVVFLPLDTVGAEPEELLGGPRSVTGFSARRDRSAIAFTATDPATPGELGWREGGREHTLTDLARVFRAEVDVRPTERFVFDRDGAELDVWATLPDGLDHADPGTVPVLLSVHGGPTAQYGEYFHDEFQVHAGAGYLVVGTNPRGSSGRGTRWARAVVGAWTDPDSVDMLDLRAVVDATLERYPQADPERVGIAGGSYGGYAVARIVARDHRFRSAVAERGLLQWESFSGTSDIGPFFDRMFLGTGLADGAGAHHDASPVRLAGAIATPTLVLHSEADWRCPIEQGEQLFAALKRAGVPTEMVRFPDEGHELSRSGSPRHRVERFEIMLDWHRRYLGTASGETAAGG
jgi:dipeptidyl aminopeptidase/acylaminoacyl peptidase